MDAQVLNIAYCIAVVTPSGLQNHWDGFAVWVNIDVGTCESGYLRVTAALAAICE
jgi:hypothetical protein